MNAPAYPKTKKSGVEWLGDIPEHWEVRRLKFAVSCNDETLPENTDSETEIEYVDISSVSLAEGITSTETVAFEKAPSRARRKVRDGDTIVSTVRTYLKAIAPINKPPENLIVSTGFAVIRPLEIMEPTFLGYFLQSQGFVDSVVANSKGVSYPAINPSELVCIPVSYPKSKNEQKAIAEFLDRKTGRIDELIGKKKELIEKLNEQRSALITHAVTKGLDDSVPMKDSGIAWLGEIPEHWDVKATKTIATLVGRIGFRGYSTQDIVNEEEGAISLSPSNMRNGRIRWENSTYVSWDKYYESPEIMIERGDCVMVKTGSTFGKVSYCNEVEYPATINPQLMLFKRTAGNSKWLFYVLFCTGFQYEISLLNKGSTIPTITQDSVGRLGVPMPPMNEQQAIIDYPNTAGFV